MILTKDKLVALWKRKNEIFGDERNKLIVERFDKINTLFEKMKNIEVNEDELAQKIIVKENENVLEIQDVDFSYFGITKDKRDFCRDRTKGVEPVKLMAEELSVNNKSWNIFIQDVGCLLSGFDFCSTINDKYKMRAEYRILSNNKVGYDDNASLTVGGQYQASSSQLSGNNYFFWVVRTINYIREGKFKPKESQLVLSYPKEGKLESDDEQKKMLEVRFPYKFFYMWTHKDDVIHPFSIMAYKKFISQKDEILQYSDDMGMNQPYENFTTRWKDYSQKIVELIPQEVRGDNFISELSKLISIIMVNNQDIKNIRDLAETGNKAIILWGPPGTGKTYQAMELVKDMLDIPDKDDREESETEMKKYRFPKIDSSGSFDVVQFHPNYSYEDFVGGISPKLNGETLNYFLKVGRFKKFCDEASKDENKGKKFIFIIDEINRADLSAVFGELLYALEYRDKPVSIPNFKEQFVIPSNVYIIGTMNNVDKSLVSFDLALRRRFGFFKVMPNLNLLESLLADLIDEDKLSEYIKRCKELNEKILNKNEFGLGEDYQIGHAYFLKIKDFLPKTKPADLTTFELEKLWAYHIEPLLEEYLGNKIEDDNIKNKIESLKKNFTQEI